MRYALLAILLTAGCIIPQSVPQTLDWQGAEYIPASGIVYDESELEFLGSTGDLLVYRLPEEENLVFTKHGPNYFAWQKPALDAHTLDESKKIAEEFVKSSKTYQFDGIEGSLEHKETLTARCPYCWKFVFEFDCRQAGYGDRTGMVLAQMITHHTAAIMVREGKVESALLDQKWDMLEQSEI